MAARILLPTRRPDWERRARRSIEEEPLCQTINKKT